MKNIGIMLLIAAAGVSAFAARLADFKPLDPASLKKTVMVFDFERGSKLPELPEHWRIADGDGVSSTGGLTLSRTVDDKYTFVSIPIRTLTPGNRYRLTATVKIEGLTNAKGQVVKNGGAKIAIVDYRKNNKVIGSSGPLRVAAPDGKCDWTTVHIEFVMPRTADSVNVNLSVMPRYAWDSLPACTRVSYDNVKIEQLGDNVILYPLLPKQLKLDDRGLVRLRVVDAATGGKRKLVAFAKLEDGKELFCKVAVGTANFKFGKLAAGRYRIDFFVGDLDTKKIVATAAYPFTVTDAKPPAGAVVTESDARVLVDGKPFFPVGFYVNHKTLTKEDIVKLREAGANTLLPGSTHRMLLPDQQGETGVAAVRASMDYLHKEGFKVIFGMGLFPGSRGIVLDDYDGVKGRHNVARHIVNGIKDHPALLAWYISDENDISTLNEVCSCRCFISQLDPFHPVVTLTNIPENYIYFGPTGDIMAMDRYPIYTKATQSIDIIRKCFATQRAVCRLGAWWVPQIFNWGIYRGSEPYDKFRYPTEEEMRSQVLFALNQRARAIIFYSYDSVWRHDKFDKGASEWFWPQVQTATKLAKELTPFFLVVGEPKEVRLTQTGKSKIEAKMHRASGRTIVAVTADGPGDAKAVLNVGIAGLRSRYGRTKELGGGKYEFTAKNISSDLLEK